MADSGPISTQAENQDEQDDENARPELEFLNISDESININIPDGPGGHGQNTEPRESESNVDEDQYTVDEVLERELAALLGQTDHTEHDAGSEVRDSGCIDPALVSSHANATTLVSHEGHGPTSSPAGEFQQPSREQYLSGLAAVLQAAHAIQSQVAVVKSTPGFHSLNADLPLHPPGEEGGSGSGGGAEVVNENDLSELIAQLTAQLEQVGAGHFAQIPPFEDPAFTTGATATNNENNNPVVETYSIFGPAARAPPPAAPMIATLQYYLPIVPNPGPLTGTFPYYSPVFAAQAQPQVEPERQVPSQAPVAGPSTPPPPSPPPVQPPPPPPVLSSPSPTPPPSALAPVEPTHTVDTDTAALTNIETQTQTQPTTTTTSSSRRRNADPNRVRLKPGRRKLPDDERKSYVCEFCSKKFWRKSDAERHFRTHTGDRPFPCPVEGCDKAFIQRSALHVHLRVHSGEKPHMCEYPGCGMTFGDSSSLARHRRTHTGKRPYACQWPGCHKEFTRRTTLTNHMRSHDPDFEPDPNIRYSFKPKPKRRKLNDGQVVEAGEDEEEDDDDDDEEDDDTVIDPALEESVRTLTALLSQKTSSSTASPSQTTNTKRDLGRTVTQQGTTDGGAGTNAQIEARVVAISAEIAAAIAQAQAQIQAEMLNDDDDDDDEDDGEGSGEGAGSALSGKDTLDFGLDFGAPRGIAANVSEVRTERLSQSRAQPESTTPHPPFSAPAPPPVPNLTLVPAPASPPADATEPELAASLLTWTVGTDSANVADAPAESNHGMPTLPTTKPETTTTLADEEVEDEDDFPVPLRERKGPKPSTIPTTYTQEQSEVGVGISDSNMGSKRKR